MLRILLVWIRSYLKSILRYQFLILDTYHPNTLYVHQEGCEDPWLNYEARRCPRAKKVWETIIEQSTTASISLES